ncbi:MAG: hypothetical protein AAGA24_03885 [Pseudomonadota bacterium]
MARRRRRNRQSKQRNQAILNFAMAFIAVAIIGFAMFAIQPAPYDETTLCELSDDLPPHTAVIIDKTDSYTPAQAELIAAVIRRSRDRLDVGERFTLFELDAQGQFDPRGEFSLCNPGRGDQVNALFQNPRQIEERFAEKFEKPLETALVDLVEPKVAPNSPIIEALARLSQTDAFSTRAPARRIVLISDMLQNSDIFTAYGGRGEMPGNIPESDVTTARLENTFGRGLSGVALEIRLIPRERYVDLQRGGLRDYWDDVFRDLGVSPTWRDL